MDLSKYVDMFRREARERLSRAETALSASGAAGIDEAVRAFHSVKGSALTLGLDAIGGEAERAEVDARNALVLDDAGRTAAAERLLVVARDLLSRLDAPT